MGRTLAEYENAFGQLSDQVLSGPFNTKAEARHLVALANQACRTARNTFTQEITMTWKQGFAELKKENDSLQFELYKWFKTSQNDIWYKYPLVKGRRVAAAAVETKELYNERQRRTKEISQTWKDGYAKLKAENDQMQKDLAQAFKDELQMIDERLGDMYEGLQG